METSGRCPPEKVSSDLFHGVVAAVTGLLQVMELLDLVDSRAWTKAHIL